LGSLLLALFWRRVGARAAVTGMTMALVVMNVLYWPPRLEATKERVGLFHCRSSEDTGRDGESQAGAAIGFVILGRSKERSDARRPEDDEVKGVSGK